MSEGPEVWRIAAEQDKKLGGSELLEVETRLRKAKDWIAEHPDQLLGRRVERVIPRGKHILWFLEDDLWFHFHLLMFGRWDYYPPGAEVPWDALMRAQIRTTTKLLTLCSGQVFDIGSGDPETQVPALVALGPDICATPFDGEEFKRRLLRPKNLNDEIGPVLLDQTVAAGIGNYIKAEILFECRLNPWRLVGSLASDEIDCLADTTASIAQRALANRGRTLPDAILVAIAAGTIAPPRSRGQRHWVFRRTNLPCYICGTPIKQKRQGPNGGRWTYWCPGCQGTIPASEKDLDAVAYPS